MAIFNNETQFYNQPAPAFEYDQPPIRRFIAFVYDHVFVATIPLSILLTYLLMSRSANLHSGQIGLVTVAASLTTVYLGLIGLPALVSLFISSPMLFAWRTQRHRLFKRVFKIAFVFLYLFVVVVMLIASFLPQAK